MKTSTFLVLLLLVVLAGAAVFLGGDGDGPSAPGDATGPLLGDLIDRVNDVDRLVVRDVNGEVTLTRSADGARWSVDELQGYAADFEDVKAAIVGAARLEKIERKTGRREHFERLGVQDVELARTAKQLGTLDPAATGPLELRLAAGDATLATLILGARGAGRDERYARVVGGESSWLVKGAIDAAAAATGWVDTQVADVAATRLSRVTTVHSYGEIVETVRADEESTDWEVVGVPEGFELVYEGAGRQPASGVSALAFDDLRPGTIADLAAEDHVTTTYTTFDGLTVTVTSAPVPEPEDADAALAKAIEIVVDAAAQDDASEEVKAEAAAIRAAAEGWIFSIPTWKGDAMRKRMADLVTPIPPPEPAPDDAEDDAPPATETPAPGPDPAGEAPVEPPTDDPGASAPEPAAQGDGAGDGASGDGGMN